MTPARYQALGCPACGSAVDAAASSCFVECPSCGSPLAVRTPDGVPRRALLPVLDSSGALAAARGCWEGPMVPRGLTTTARIDSPRLAFVAFWEVERTAAHDGSERTVLVESLRLAPAVRIPGVPVEAVASGAPRASGEWIPFDPIRMQRLGLVFDPSLDAIEAVPPDPFERILEERVSVVYLPVWIVRCRYGRNLYEVVVDAVDGSILRGRAPAVRDARLPQAIAAVYLLALSLALIVREGLYALVWALGLQGVGVVGGLLALAGLAAVAAWTWDRIRFRYEVVVEGPTRRLEAINRPARTAPEKIRDALVDRARRVLDRSPAGSRA